jgi:hypothetical protein
LDRRRNNLCWLLCALGLLTGLTLLPGQALGDAPAQGPDATPTLPPAVWLTPVGGEEVPGVTGPNYLLLGGVALVLLLLGGAALVGVVVFLLRRKKPPGAARPAPAAAPRYTLVVQAGPGAGARYPLTQAAVTLGRGPDCQVVINHPNVSSHHARLIWDGRQVVVQDLGSTNGTFVNDYRITEPVLFRSGDVLSLGRVVRLVLQAGG